MKCIYWKIDFFHPANNVIIETKQFKNITDIATYYKNIPLSTWKNISMGRCKIYKKFIKITKCNINND